MTRILLIPLLSLCATSLLFADYYIADTGGGVSGNGTQGNPTNCGVGGSDLVTVMTSIPVNTVIHIGAGNYYPSNDLPLKAGWSVIGAGMGQTIIHVGGVSPTKGGHGENYVFRMSDDFAENVYVSDLTADCNTTVQNCETGAIAMQCKTGIIERVEMINPKATISYGNEGSPLCVYNNLTVGWGRIADCKVTIAPVSDPNPAYPGPGQPAFLDNYLAALSVFGQGSGDMSGEVENNTVTCTGTPSPGAVGTITAYGTGHAHDMVLRNNFTFHVDVGITMDTYSKTNISIIGNYFMDCVLLGMNIGGGVCDGFLIRDNVITTRADGFIFTGNTSNFTVSNNFVSGVAGYTPTSGLVVTTTYGPNSHYIFSGNQIAPNLSVSITSGVTDYALYNQTGTIGGGIPGNYTTSNHLTNTVTTTTTPTVNVYNSLDFATITVTGAAVGDAVTVGLPNPPPAQFVFDAYVSAANTVKIRASNVAGANRSLPTGTYRVTVLK